MDFTKRPTILKIGPYRFFFVSLDYNEPPHIHVKRENKVAKFWIDPVTLQKTGVYGGEPVIVGTRISVRIIVEMERADQTVDEIVAMYSHITHAQVYDALSYYYDHKKEIDNIIDENKEEYWKEKTKGESWRRFLVRNVRRI